MYTQVVQIDLKDISTTSHRIDSALLCVFSIAHILTHVQTALFLQGKPGHIKNWLTRQTRKKGKKNVDNPATCFENEDIQRVLAFYHAPVLYSVYQKRKQCTACVTTVLKLQEPEQA